MNNNYNQMIRKGLSLLMLCGCCSLMAQTSYPGGVKSPLVWLKAEPVSNDKLDGEYHWTNYVESNDYVLNCENNKEFAPVERKSIHTYNFNPSIPFMTNNSLELNIKGSALRQATIIGVYGYKQDENAFNTMVYKLEGKDGLLMTREKVYKVDASTSFEYTGFISKSEEKEDIQRVKINSYVRSLSPNISVWDDINAKMDLGSVVKHQSDVVDYSDRVKDPDIKVSSYLSEMLVFGRALTETERIQVETYLAFRYGITLDGKYLSSKGEDVTPGFKNRVFAYGLDKTTEFEQPSSTTAYEENVYLLDDTYDQKSSQNLSSKFNLLVGGFSNKEEMVDGSLVVIGDNGSAPTSKEKYPIGGEDEDIAKFTEIYHFMQREWSARVVDVDPATSHLFELGYVMTDCSGKGEPFGRYKDSKVYMVVDQTGDGKFNNDNLDNLVFYPMTSLDEERKKMVFDNVKFPDLKSFKFTFAYKGTPDLTYNVEDELTEEEKAIMKFTAHKGAQDNEMDVKDPGDGVEDVAKKTAISWYMYSDPKSADKGFTAGVRLEETEPVTFYVFDVNGRFIAESSANVSDGVAEKYIQVPRKGVYVVKLVTEKSRNVFVGKILVK